MAKQLTLSIALRDDARFNNFYPGDNTLVTHSLQQQWTTKGEPFIYLWGSHGSGRSHLLQAACHYATGLGHQSMYLPLQEVAQYGPEVLEGIDSLPLVALDDVHLIAGQNDWEEALFHFFNRIRQQQSHLIMTACAPANQLNLALPDLISRLNWGTTFQLQPLNDDQRVLALLMRAKQRGLNLSDDVARYITNHGPREMHALFELLAKLDDASLVEQRKLTIPFIKNFL